MKMFNVQTPAGRAMFLAYELHRAGRISAVECEAFISVIADIADREVTEIDAVLRAEAEALHQTKQ